MLQRAASNAYSWWWASHIRTKQSKWLEANLQDMDEKVKIMLKIIENDGDSFAQRVEMYYKKRPELINHVEDSYRAYRALAERFDHLSKDLQSANRTIATVFPEHVQFAMDDDDDYEENVPTTSSSCDDPSKECNVSDANIPEVPSMPKKEFRSQSMLLSRKGQPNRTASSAKPTTPRSSGLSQEEALGEIDNLQKEILALQTEKEFSQSVYKRSQAKCRGIENQITEMQTKISNLQDEFGISKFIDDDEARTLMAATAIKSCHETLIKLQEKQEQSAEEAKIEHQRIKEVQQKLTSLKGEFLSEQTDSQEPTDEQDFKSENIEQHDMEQLREKIKSQFDADLKSSLTVTQLAERIDGLVEKVVDLETAVSSQEALVNRIRSNTNELQAHVKTLEEDKETLKESSENTSNKLKELEEEVRRLKILNQSIIGQNNKLLTHFAEANCNIDHLSAKLLTVKPDEEVENPGLIEDFGAAPEAKADGGYEEHEDKQVLSKATEIDEEEKKDKVPAPSDFVIGEELDPSQKLHVPPEHLLPTQDKKDLPCNEPEELGADEEDQPNWRQLFVGGLEDREKLLLEEYTSVLRNYKDVRKKLGEVEKKNRDGFFELALQIRELKNALALRDEEIQSLRKMSCLQQNEVENHDNNLTKFKYLHREGSPESMTQAASCLDSYLSPASSPQRPVFDSASEHHIEYRGRTRELVAFGGIKRYPSKEVRHEIKMKCVNSNQAPSAIEEKFRSDIDELLEENLEFWLRFSTSLHQVQKYQTSLHDLTVELSKLKDNRRQDGSHGSQSFVSEARPIYTHMREIQTELALWLENNAVLKDQMQGRYASLCNIQDELSRICNASCKAEEAELSDSQAAKFQGEILNMKQESNKIADELQSGLDRVIRLKVEVDDILTKLDEELGISASKHRSSSHRTRIPLRSFLFGVKLKKPRAQKTSIFSCGSPALQKQYSDMVEAGNLSP